MKNLISGYRIGSHGWKWCGYQGLDVVILNTPYPLLYKIGFCVGREVACFQFGTYGIR